MTLFRHLRVGRLHGPVGIDDPAGGTGRGAEKALERGHGHGHGGGRGSRRGRGAFDAAPDLDARLGLRDGDFRPGTGAEKHAGTSNGERHGHGGKTGHGSHSGHGSRSGEGGRGGHGARGTRALGRGELPLVMLSLLAAAPRHGYEIIRLIEERTRGAYAPSAGVIYPTLALLEDQGLIASHIGNDGVSGNEDGGKRRFAATDAGRHQAETQREAIDAAFARLDRVGHVRAREALPDAIHAAMHALKRALLSPTEPWELAKVDRVAHEILKAADAVGAIVGMTTKGATTMDTRTAAASSASAAPTDGAADGIVADISRYLPRRERREPVRRMLTVKRVARIADHMVRITLTGDELSGFESASFDDHIKVFFPRPGETEPFIPADFTKKRIEDESQRPISRDYTPRRYDAAANELDIDFVMHGDGDGHAAVAGAGAGWAALAKPGDRLGIAGPRGSFVIPDTFDWYLLVGDETAMPAIGRRIEELPSNARAIVVVEAGTTDDLPDWTARPNVQIVPALRHGAAAGTTDVLVRTLRATPLPDGIGHVWIAAESAAARALRVHVVDICGVDKRFVRAASYWRVGANNHHESLDD